jgi:hypothetical protein
MDLSRYGVCFGTQGQTLGEERHKHRFVIVTFKESVLLGSQHFFLAKKTLPQQICTHMIEK